MTDLRWSRGQETALAAVRRWMDTGDSPVFRLFGYAGTGKTTLAREIAASVGGTVLFGAYTGKAAYVLRKSGCPGATTLHSLIYKPKQKSELRLRELQEEITRYVRETESPDERHVAALREEIAAEEKNLERPCFALNTQSPLREASLLIVDECSMVDERMGQDLLSFETPVLVLGDPAQLPPVRGEGFFTGREPDVMLTEIHRQARDNPIIDLATRVRSGEELVFGEYGRSRVMDWADVEATDAQQADQVLVGTNRLRRGTNARMRELQGRESSLPTTGDKLVCLRNDHEAGLLNGAIWHVRGATQVDDDRIHLELGENGEGPSLPVTAHVAPFLGEDVPWYEKREAQEFDYGYALTTHKAQGSQWDDVLIFDQSKVFRQHSRRWLYTAITRAAERVTVVR